MNIPQPALTPTARAEQIWANCHLLSVTVARRDDSSRASRVPVAAEGRARMARREHRLFAAYWASPFRTVDRDFEASCYQAAAVLRNAAPAGTLVSIGDGPYPEHGVGFEAGPYLAYLAGWRLVGGNSELPRAAEADALASKALAGKADAVVVWGSPSDPAYVQIVETVKLAPGLLSATPFADPDKGEVGTVFLFSGRIERKTTP